MGGGALATLVVNGLGGRLQTATVDLTRTNRDVLYGLVPLIPSLPELKEVG